MQKLVVYFNPFRQATTETGSLQKKKRRCVVLSFAFAMLIGPWTHNGIREGVRRKSLTIPANFSCTHVNICVKDATPLPSMYIPLNSPILFLIIVNRTTNEKTVAPAVTKTMTSR